MARVSTPDKFLCDQCGAVMSEHHLFWHVQRGGMVTTMADDPDGYDLCSTECLTSWAATRREREARADAGAAPPPHGG